MQGLEIRGGKRGFRGFLFFFGSGGGVWVPETLNPKPETLNPKP